MYDLILNMIPRNAEQRITASQIGKSLSIKGAKVRRYINEMRSSGVPVCSDQKGYYISTDEAHVKTQIASMENRISAMENAIGGLNLFLSGQGAYINS